MNIHNISLTRLRIPGFIQFLADALKTITGILTIPTDQAAIADEQAAFSTAKEDLEAVYATDPASPLTDAVIALDARRDAAFTCLYYLCLGYSFSNDNAKKEAAKTLLRGLDIYGNIRNKPLQDETAAITSLVKDLSEKVPLANAVTTLGLADQVAELKAANEAFNDKYLERNNETAASDPGTNTTELRRPAIAAWNALREQIDAMYIVKKKAAPWSTLVASLNALIDKNVQTIDVREGHAAKAAAGTGDKPAA